MQKIALLIMGFVFITSCTEAQDQKSSGRGAGKTTTQQPSGISKVVSAAEFQKLLALENRQLIDVRTADEYSAGKIDNATNIDFYGADFKNQMAKLDKNKPVLVYCASGGRSGNTAAMLKEMGFKEIYDLQGGFRGWPYK